MSDYAIVFVRIQYVHVCKFTEVSNRFEPLNHVLVKNFTAGYDDSMCTRGDEAATFRACTYILNSARIHSGDVRGKNMTEKKNFIGVICVFYA